MAGTDRTRVQMKKKRDLAAEIIDNLKELHATLRASGRLRGKYTVRKVRAVPEPSQYSADDVKALREKLGVSQPIFARMLGVSAALVRAWENGQRQRAPIARRPLDTIRENPARWRAMVEAA